MKVTRVSILSGVERTLELPIDPTTLARYEAGEGLIQNMFPNLSADEREFIMTGISPDEWNKVS